MQTNRRTDQQVQMDSEYDIDQAYMCLTGYPKFLSISLKNSQTMNRNCKVRPQYSITEKKLSMCVSAS